MPTSDSPPLEGVQPRPDRSGIFVFFSILGILTGVRIATAFIPAPLGAVKILSIVATILFIGLPIYGLFRAAESPWTKKMAAFFLVGGILGQAGCILLATLVGPNVGGLIFIALAQVGLICWCVGLGALLVTSLKDRNLLIPVSIFLGFFDLFLVFAPVGPTKLIMQAAPKVLPTIGYSIPKIVTSPSAAPVEPYAVVGPADFIFMAMFFIALYRFGLRPKQTVIALVPTVLCYLLLSAFFGAIPLLPPIVVVVLLVNIREFKMNKEEKVSTAAVAVFCAALVAWGATRPKPPIEIERRPSAPAPRAPAGSPSQAS